MSATQEFGAPEISEDDYYNRIGAPQSADPSDIGNHTKKYVAEFKPELSTHENADERWKRFNTARQTLSSPDSKEDYDVFRERFGAEQASEAYEKWQATGKLASPSTVPADELGLEPEVDKSKSRRRGSEESSRARRKQRTTREERQRERRERREAGETDIDTDSSKTYSTRTTSKTQDEDTDTRAESDTSSPGTFSRVIDRVRSGVDLAATEVSIMLSLLDLVLLGYLLYSLLVGLGLATVPSETVRSFGTVVVGLALVGGLSWEYLDRFEARFIAGGVGSVGDYFTSSDNPTRLLAVPAVSSALWGLILIGGGGALTVLLLAVSLVSLYGRLRGIKRLVSLPDWTDYAEPGAGILASVAFILLFVQSGQLPGTGGPMTGADTPILAGIGVLLLVLVGLPVAAVGQRLTE